MSRAYKCDLCGGLFDVCVGNEMSPYVVTPTGGRTLEVGVFPRTADGSLLDVCPPCFETILHALLTFSWGKEAK